MARLSCQMLDEALGPALRDGHVVEVVGEAGSGKTQFLLDVTSSVASGGARVAYVSTEAVFPIDRLKTMLDAAAAAAPTTVQASDNILLDSAFDFVSSKP